MVFVSPRLCGTSALLCLLVGMLCTVEDKSRETCCVLVYRDDHLLKIKCKWPFARQSRLNIAFGAPVVKQQLPRENGPQTAVTP